MGARPTSALQHSSLKAKLARQVLRKAVFLVHLARNNEDKRRDKLQVMVVCLSLLFCIN